MAKNPYEKNGENERETENDGFFDDELVKNVSERVEKESEEKNQPQKSKNPYMGGAFEEKGAEKTEKKNNPYAMQQNQNEGGRYSTNPKKRCKTGQIVLCILLSVVFFLAGGVTSWFLCDEETRSFLKVKFLIENLYYEEVDEEDIYDVVFDAINDKLLDPYSEYLTADEYDEMKAGNKGARSGVGIVFKREFEGDTERLRVVRVCGNSPAEEAGVKIGSYLTGFGESEDSLQICTGFEAFWDFLEDYDSGEQFYIRVEEESGTKVLPICKAEYIENYVFYRTRNSSYGFTGDKATTLTEKGEALPCLQEDAAYIRLTQFNGSASEQFDKAMQLFKKDKKTNLVLDLRGNGGGSVDILCDIAKYFCKDAKNKQPLVAVSEYRNHDEKYYAPENLYYEYFSEDSRIYILADNDTASASEALMGCMLDYRATNYENICLSYRTSANATDKKEAKTYGKGIMQMTIPLLFGDDALKLTVSKIVWPISGDCIHGRGILPEDGTKTVEEYRNDDEEIQKAIQILTGAA